MKSQFLLGLLFVLCINVNAITTTEGGNSISQICPCQKDCFDNHVESTTVKAPPIGSDSSADSLSYTTALINALNNAITIENNSLTKITIIIGILGLIIALSGILGYIGLKNDIKEYKGDIQKKVDELEGLNNAINQKLILINNIQSRQEYQNMYLERINQYLFLITNSVVDSNQGDGKAASSIRNLLYNKYQTINLFLNWSDTTVAAFMYLQARGTENDIEDLQIIADKDPDERKRKMASETIGCIKTRIE